MSIRSNGGKKTPSEIKKTIMEANGWTTEEYRKNRYIFRNKLKMYEALEKARGHKVEEQSPTELLYRIAKAKQHYGSEYKPSQKLQIIESMKTYSISKSRKIAQKPQSEAFKRAVGQIVQTRFEDFIKFYDVASEIDKKIADPVEKEKALVDFATKLHAEQPRRGKDKGAGGIRQGETYGSGAPSASPAAFDITKWIV